MPQEMQVINPSSHSELDEQSVLFEELGRLMRTLCTTTRNSVTGLLKTDLLLSLLVTAQSLVSSRFSLLYVSDTS